MEHLYAFEIGIIQWVQEWFADAEDYLNLVNKVSNPNNALTWIFPIIAIVDSVFAAELLLCMAFGEWLNAVMKWWILEDRPYWWVQETDYYTAGNRPSLRQYGDTCNTGPGSPSNHSTSAAMVMVLFVYWISHFINDRKLEITWWKYIVYPVCWFYTASVMLARVFVGTHFPHQVVLGAFIGALMCPALCIYVADPFIWQYGYYKGLNINHVKFWHVMSSLTLIAIALITYLGLKLCGWDPLWTVSLAFRWCQNPETIHYSTTPMFGLAHSTGYVLGWALCVTPAVAEYRHYTKNRSLIVAVLVVGLLVYIWRQVYINICKAHAVKFYASIFVLFVMRPVLFLRLAPFIATLPYRGMKEKVR